MIYCEKGVDKMESTYVAIDLKSFYASVECAERGLDPLNTNLVVADESRTDKTICLAVSPPLKARGVSGRPRLFEVVEKVNEINAVRKAEAPGRRFTGSSVFDDELKKAPSLEVSYITAVPRMAKYMEYSSLIYSIYLRYVAPEDIHVYSIDEVFIDAGPYLKVYGLTAKEFTLMLIKDVLRETGITATAGIGTNLYLCKVAMDIVAKHMEPDEDGVRMAELDEMSYRRLLWNHQPITDIWRIGRGIAGKLYRHGMYTMGDVARCSVGGKNDFLNEDLLYRLFGVNAELLIDHAWGWEPCTMKDIKEYRPRSSSLSCGQVLQEGYDNHKAEIVVREMAGQLALDLFEKRLVTGQIVLAIGYDRMNLRRGLYSGEIQKDHLGRDVPVHSHGSFNLSENTSSESMIVSAAVKIFHDITDEKLLIRRITIAASDVMPEGVSESEDEQEQLSMFVDYEKREEEKARHDRDMEKERSMTGAVADIKRKYGKNAVVKGMSLQKGATAMERNRQIGGHKA